MRERSAFQGHIGVCYKLNKTMVKIITFVSKSKLQNPIDKDYCLKKIIVKSIIKL